MNNAGAESITASTTIDDVVTRHPATARVFIRRRMHCVGCEIDRFHTVADVCRIYGQPLTAFLAELGEAAGAAKPPLQPLANHQVAK